MATLATEEIIEDDIQKESWVLIERKKLSLYCRMNLISCFHRMIYFVELRESRYDDVLVGRGRIPGRNNQAQGLL
jgi:hypothetical protein